jgi:hypothetical protein
MLPIPVASDFDPLASVYRPDYDPRAVLYGRDPAVRTSSVGDATDDSLRLFLRSFRTHNAPMGLSYID